MDIVKIIISIIQVISALGLIVLIIFQEGNENGLSARGGGSTAESFFGKNKGRTIEAKLNRWTIICGSVFVVLTLALNAIQIYMK